MLMHRPQLGFPSVCRLFFLCPRHESSRTSSTKGADRDHSAPVTACDGQCLMQSTHSPHRHRSMGWSGRICASVSTVARESRGPCSGLMSSPFFPIQPSPADVAAILWLKSEYSWEM